MAFLLVEEIKKIDSELELESQTIALVLTKIEAKKNELIVRSNHQKDQMNNFSFKVGTPLAVCEQIVNHLPVKKRDELTWTETIKDLWNKFIEFIKNLLQKFHELKNLLKDLAFSYINGNPSVIHLIEDGQKDLAKSSEELRQLKLSSPFILKEYHDDIIQAFQKIRTDYEAIQQKQEEIISNYERKQKKVQEMYDNIQQQSIKRIKTLEEEKQEIIKKISEMEMRNLLMHFKDQIIKARNLINKLEDSGKATKPSFSLNEIWDTVKNQAKGGAFAWVTGIIMNNVAPMLLQEYKELGKKIVETEASIENIRKNGHMNVELKQKLLNYLDEMENYTNKLIEEYNTILNTIKGTKNQDEPSPAVSSQNIYSSFWNTTKTATIAVAPLVAINLGYAAYTYFKKEIPEETLTDLLASTCTIM